MALMQKPRRFTYRPPRRRVEQLSKDEQTDRSERRMRFMQAGEQKKALNNTVRLLMMLAAIIGLAGIMAVLR